MYDQFSFYKMTIFINIAPIQKYSVSISSQPHASCGKAFVPTGIPRILSCKGDHTHKCLKVMEKEELRQNKARGGKIAKTRNTAPAPVRKPLRDGWAGVRKA